VCALRTFFEEDIKMAHKHLTSFDRLEIEEWLKKGVSIKKIATRLGKSTSTISREIRKHSTPSNKSGMSRIPNRCIQRHCCSIRQLCEDKADCIKICRSCNLCNTKCLYFEEEVCSKLDFPPYVCNGCTNEHRCTLRKLYYTSKRAHKSYREILVQSRQGANISEKELLQLDRLVSPLIKQGQSVHHIAVHNSDEFTISEKTLYRYVNGGLLAARNIDMPRVVRFKPRRSKPVEHKVDPKCRIGRTYQDFQSVMNQKNTPAVVEMDSVIGVKGGKVLLTLAFRSCDLSLAFLREQNTSRSVIDVFNDLYPLFGQELFCRLFPLLLTDNGSEFSNPRALEFAADGNRRTSIFYCDPRASYQKPHVELSHEYIRRILPKGSSFDHLTQTDINLMMSHINSYSREKWGDRSPFELFGFLYGSQTLERLGITRIPPNEIILKPYLLPR
jgi:IS30 family transposase